LRNTVKSDKNVYMLTARSKNIMRFSKIRNKDLGTWTSYKDRFSDIISANSNYNAKTKSNRKQAAIRIIGK